ncbi:MAG: type III pantothenate kinase [Bacteroidales bacterium]|nr:type III pantothenate kinase [Bacteroidales bacterium]
MNLIIDIGNTVSKLAVFEMNEKIFISRIQSITEPLLKEIKERFSINKVIYSTVASDNQSEILLKSIGIEPVKLSNRTPLPFSLDYSSPETLGTDRLAGVAGAYNKFPGKNVLIIDAGTAVTYDFLTSDGIFKGGNISPGLAMRFRALHEFTGRLPLVKSGNEFSTPGKTTEEAIRAGVQQGLIFEINEYIRTFKKRHRDLVVLFTGGDGRFIMENRGLQGIFTPDLIVEGLNFILNHNA